jgi:hypothetical protein
MDDLTAVTEEYENIKKLFNEIADQICMLH